MGSNGENTSLQILCGRRAFKIISKFALVSKFALSFKVFLSNKFKNIQCMRNHFFSVLLFPSLCKIHCEMEKNSKSAWIHSEVEFLVKTAFSYASFMKPNLQCLMLTNLYCSITEPWLYKMINKMTISRMERTSSSASVMCFRRKLDSKIIADLEKLLMNSFKIVINFKW